MGDECKHLNSIAFFQKNVGTMSRNQENGSLVDNFDQRNKLRLQDEKEYSTN